jgi:uncharacterized protein
MSAASLFGKSLGFPPRVGADGRMAWSAGEANIHEHIAIILKTDRGERVMLPGFGAGLSRFLFEPNTAATHARITHAIETALKRWEPRINLTSVRVGPDPDDATAAIAHIAWKLVATGAEQQTSLVLPLGTGRA